MSGKNNRPSFIRMAAMLSASLLAFSCTDELLDTTGPVGLSGVGNDSICFGVSSSDAMTKASGSWPGRILGTDSFVLRSKDSSDTLCVTATITEGIDLSPLGEEMPLTRAAQVSSLDTYGGFRVQAHCTDYSAGNGVPLPGFFMDEAVNDSDNDRIWSTANVHYWPGEDYQLKFYAWAPADAFSAVPTTPESTKLVYAVPKDVAEQHDLLVAVTSDDIQGDYNQAVALTFRHILTAVKFEVGSQMQPGTIKSVALKGVIGGGTYDMNSDKWNLDRRPGADFAQNLDKDMTGSEQDGSGITAADGFFMMVPQTLPAGAYVEVVFNDGVSGDRTMTADIGSTQWPQGMTVTYKLSISPNYNFELETNPVLDAHYEILLTNLVVSGVPDGQQWTITAPTLDGKSVTVQAQGNMNSFARNGYWTDRNIDDNGDDQGSARGSNTFTGIGSGSFPIAVFVPENIGDGTRIINMVATLGDNVVSTLVINQLSPCWYGNNIGCERIEDGDAPWGFYWDDNFAIIYDLTKSNDENARESIRQYVEWIQNLRTLQNIPFIGWILEWIFGTAPDLSFVDMEKSKTGIFGLGGIADEITINLGELHPDGVAESESNGQQNTRDIYNFEGMQLVNRLISLIQAIPGYSVTTRGEGLFPDDNAAITCMELNCWNIIQVGDGNENLLKLHNENDMPEWYLPAVDEVSGLTDSSPDYALDGEYWTSTAVRNNNEYAYKYNSAGKSTDQERRNVELHVRAVRQRP